MLDSSKTKTTYFALRLTPFFNDSFVSNAFKQSNFQKSILTEFIKRRKFVQQTTDHAFNAVFSVKILCLND